jgi:glycosyltransferase involved in cell wall biosynthesis
MDKDSRFRIGIIFNFTQSWLGGFYYYQNIIKALNFLEDNEKPEIIIFYNKDFSKHLEDIHYPYLQLVPWNFGSINKGYLISFLKRKNIFADEMISKYQLQGIYPVNDNPVSSKKTIPAGTIAAAWFPDLQHKFFPQFFDKKRLWLRELRLKITLKNATDLVVSSNDTVDHFRQFYKMPAGLKVHVLQFVSILDRVNAEDITALRKTYNIPTAYFIVSNSFLKHKNHLIVFKALHLLKLKNQPVHIVFTGKMEVYADATYLNQLQNFIKENNLLQHVSLLGIIPREHQLCIMKNAKAVLQPSLFEGWNTTVEDAKSMQLPVIASGIAVHKEQLKDKGIYFDPQDENNLADVLANFSTANHAALYPEYNERVKIFARTFINIFRQ